MLCDIPSRNGEGMVAAVELQLVDSAIETMRR